MLVDEFILNLVITIFVYLLAPTIISLIGKKFKKSTIKLIAIINAIVCCLAFMAIRISLELEATGSFSPAILWGFVGYRIMKKRCGQRDIDIETISNENATESVIVPPNKDTSSQSQSANNKQEVTQSQLEIIKPSISCDSNFEKDSVPAPTSTQVKNTSLAQKKRFCKYCGGLIDSTRKQCTSCGKQFFKFKKKAFAASIIVLVLLSSLGFNVYQGFISSQLSKEISAQTIEIDALRRTAQEQGAKLIRRDRRIAELEDKEDFLDSYIVLVSSGASRYYHKYGCQLINLDSFWVYSVGEANRQGLSPCDECH